MLQIKDLKAGIEDNQILKGINLEVKAGEIHAIMGPNGSGKSTLSAVMLVMRTMKLKAETLLLTERIYWN